MKQLCQISFENIYYEVAQHTPPVQLARDYGNLNQSAWMSLNLYLVFMPKMLLELLNSVNTSLKRHMLFQYEGEPDHYDADVCNAMISKYLRWQIDWGCSAVWQARAADLWCFADSFFWHHYEESHFDDTPVDFNAAFCKV